MVHLVSFSHQLISHPLFKTPQNFQEEQSELMDSILQILHKMDLVSGFIRFYKRQLMETHSIAMKPHNCNTILRTIPFKTIYPANVFMEKNLAHNYLMEHCIAQHAIKVFFLLRYLIPQFYNVSPALRD